jgi:thioredoxin 1
MKLRKYLQGICIAILVEAVTASRPGITSSSLPTTRNIRYNNRRWIAVNILRGGSDPISDDVSGGIDATETIAENVPDSGKLPTLDEKVYAAMRKLGLEPPSNHSNIIDSDATISSAAPSIMEANLTPSEMDTSTDVTSNSISSNNCVDGVCEIPPVSEAAGETEETTNRNDPSHLAERISNTMQVDLNMAWAALGATSVATENNTRIYNEGAARDMIQMELDMISQIGEDSEDVQSLVSEGFDPFFVRRALAFAERNLENARAILLADRLDEEEEVAAAAAEAEAADQAIRMADKQHVEASFKTVDVDASFDPTKLGMEQPEPSPPRPASRDSVIFEASAAQIQELVLESPVPVLLDIYADWCGPCKALSPILEEIAMKSGGSLRLVKVNSDNERAVSQALEVTALPTIFGLRDGKILHMFQGMPKSEEMMKNFLMGLLIPGQAFSPTVSASELQKYMELSTKLLKVAATASFSFSARERLQDRIATRMEDLVKETGNVFDAEQSIVTIRSLLSNIIRDPYEAKFRTINLSNKVIASQVAKYPACVAMLKSIGFSRDGSNLTIGKGKAFVNVAPITVTRDAIDRWIDRTRYEVAREARKRRDEEDRVRVQAELAAAKKLDEDDNSISEHNAAKELDPDSCLLKFRFDGKNRVHEVSLHADDPLSAIMAHLTDESGFNDITDDKLQEIQITCVAKRMVVKSTDQDAMNRSLRDHGLVPTANIVIKLPMSPVSATNSEDDLTTSVDTSKSMPSTLAERAANKKKLKKGTHTMQSIGIYATEDNAKGELIDGGGGTWYEQDVSDDEEQSLEQKEVSNDESTAADEKNILEIVSGEQLEDNTNTAEE